MEIYQTMMNEGCERSVITYSSLISACEKAGQWQMALKVFEKMAAEQCRPNTVTFNSLITACAQGAASSDAVYARVSPVYLPAHRLMSWKRAGPLAACCCNLPHRALRIRAPKPLRLFPCPGHVQA